MEPQQLNYPKGPLEHVCYLFPAGVELPKRVSSAMEHVCYQFSLTLEHVHFFLLMSLEMNNTF
jgi:hypothetical protein